MERLYIGDSICVTVVRLEGGQVRLGIDAPREIAVVRAELLDERRAGAKPPAAAGHVAQPAPITIRPAAAPGTGSRPHGRSR
jgi:carbon storage regulator